MGGVNSVAVMVKRNKITYLDSLQELNPDNSRCHLNVAKKQEGGVVCV